MRSSIYVFFLSLMMSAALAFAQEDADEALPSDEETTLEQDESSDDASSSEESVASDEESASDEASEGEVAKAPSGDFKGKISRKGKDWYLGETKVDQDVIIDELNANSRSASEYRTSRVFFYPGVVLAGAGVVTFGYGVVNLIMGESGVGLPATLAGVGVAGVGVLLYYIAGKYVDSSIRIYNLEVGYDMALQLQVVPTQQGGLALALAF